MKSTLQHDICHLFQSLTFGEIECSLAEADKIQQCFILNLKEFIKWNNNMRYCCSAKSDLNKKCFQDMFHKILNTPSGGTSSLVIFIQL